MHKLYLLAMLCLSVQASAAQRPDSIQAEEHVRLFGISLGDSLPALLSEMQRQGMQIVDIDSARRNVFMSGPIADIEMLVDIFTDRPLRGVHCIRMSSPKSDDRNQRADFHDLYDWLVDEYDHPDWSGTVRGHHFCRWFADFDRDIVLIATGSGNVEIWFYENHQKRNIDYYSILKYCEKNPAADVPMLTAAESVTWKRSDSTTIRRHVATRHKKRSALRRASAAKRKRAARRRSARRRR